MTPQTALVEAAAEQPSLVDQFLAVRQRSAEICDPLLAEDCTIQTMPSVSPTKWHLAHTAWFFERFILQADSGYSVYNPKFDYLFNSYYQTVGAMHPRALRGHLSRPSLAEVFDYRDVVDQAIVDYLGKHDSNDTAALLNLGMHHEQQHQELMLTDIKHVFSSNPVEPAYAHHPSDCTQFSAHDTRFFEIGGGLKKIGADGQGFSFDNETPRHEVLTADFLLADRLVTNSEYKEFIEDGGYSRPDMWLADGWTWLQEHKVDRPLYWSADLETEFTLHGRQPMLGDVPVCHVSFYEADAYARWAEARLPTEAEWEIAADQYDTHGNFYECGLLHPAASREHSGQLDQLFGDVWEWTGSSYGPYPGFQPLTGSLGEYNGKFMCSQMVARGGSCISAQDHLRATYRNFFYPSDRWQFFGIRLAKDNNNGAPTA
ncbi:MAG: ergothioneine biosynthesis protein EgtB [Gammaproteobacteria bacterium]